MADTPCTTRPYAPHDLVPAVDIWYRAWHEHHPGQRHAFPIEVWRDRWRERVLPRAKVHVATVDNAVVGYVAAFPARPWFSHVAVAPEYRRRRIGAQLLFALKETLPEEDVAFDVFEQDALARAFYTACGLIPGQPVSDPRTGHPMLRYAWPPTATPQARADQ